MGKPGGLRMRDLVLPGLGLLGGVLLLSACKPLRWHARCTAEALGTFFSRAVSARRLQTSQSQGCYKGPENTSALDVKASRRHANRAPAFSLLVFVSAQDEGINV